VENFWTSGNAEGIWKYDFIWDSTGHLYRQYSNWAAGQPDGELSPGNCIILSHVDGFKWHDVGCQSDNLRYICEKKGRKLIVNKFKTCIINDTFYSKGAKIYYSQIQLKTRP